MHGRFILKNNTKANIRNSLQEFNDLIETIAKVEYSKLSAAHLIDFSELVNIGTQVIHHFCTSSNIEDYNRSYISTAIKWAIRNEIRRRYKWYAKKSQKTPAINENDKNEIRDAIYETILSIDELAEAENPTHLKDDKKSPEEGSVFNELSAGLKKAIKKLPQRERELIEAKFYKDRKLKELATDFDISPSRVSRIIQC